MRTIDLPLAALALACGLNSAHSQQLNADYARDPAQPIDQSYTDLVKPQMNKLTHDKGLLVHVYTVDEPVDFEKVMAAGVDGIFTNRAAELLKFYKRWPSSSVQDLLKDNGY